MSSRSALLALVLLVALVLAPIVVRGRVIFPHDNHVELGDPGSAGGDLPQNRKFSDQSSYYVPEIHHHLNGDHVAWLSTWNPHVELGRPSSHVSGFSPAFVVTRVLSWFTRDAFVLYTALALLTVLLTGVFGFLFLDALALHPWACFAGASGLALGVFSLYWLTFVMFVSGLCWTLAAAWLVVRFEEKPTPARGVGLAFAVHALLLTAYPQQIVWHAYLLAGLVVARCWRKPRAIRRAAGIAACACAGFLLAAPVYADLALDAARSARIGADPSFFLSALPVADGRGALQFIAQLFDAFPVGNPIDPDHPARFNGLSLTPFFACLVLVACLGAACRRAWPWLAFSGVCLMLSLWPAAYLFAVEHLGLSFSRFVPMAAAWIPLAVAGAIALDGVLDGGLRRPWLAIALAALVPATSWAFQPRDSTFGVVAGLALYVGFACLVATRKAWLVPVLVSATVFAYGARLVLARPEADIARDSELVQRLREATSDGSRYAFVGAKAGAVLPPNQEALVGLCSIHTYDSLSSRAYQEWVTRVSTIGTRTFGRHFARIGDASRLGSPDLALGRVSTLVSVDEIQASGVRPLGSVGPFRLYRAGAEPVPVLQTASTAPNDAEFAHGGTRFAATVRAEHDDEVRVGTSPAETPTLLVLSRQHHPHWTARADGGAPLDVVAANGFYLAVRLPPATREVVLTFRPWARWSWVGHVVLAVAVAALLAREMHARRARGARSPRS